MSRARAAARPKEVIETEAPTTRITPKSDARHVRLKPRIPPPPGSNGMELVFGKFQCDETADELLGALRDLD